METPAQKFAQAIRERCADIGITLTAVCDEASIDRSTIDKMLRGERKNGNYGTISAIESAMSSLEAKHQAN